MEPVRLSVVGEEALSRIDIKGGATVVAVFRPSDSRGDTHYAAEYTSLEADNKEKQ